MALNIAPLVGPCFVITLLSFILYGLLLAQVYFYLTTYSEDHISIKVVVVVLCLLETLQVAACIHVLYTYLVVFFDDPLRIDKIIWTILLAMYLMVTINALVQTFYIYRIWRLYRNIPLITYLVTLLSACTAIAFQSCSIPYVNLDGTWLAIEASHSYRPHVIASLSLGLALDGSITLSLASILRHRLAFAHKRSNKNMMHKLMFYGLGIGFLTMITSVVTLILFITSKSPVTYGGMIVVLSKVYANSLLAMLNIREGLRKDAASDDAYSVELTGTSISPPNSTSQALQYKVQTVC
ncbi:hypothetical protein BDY19DRAFT_94041 [Irpex rosettiformis]|uniref:Uncharacterized protein n=1 Tax=Irpex rosettiformis TaxID=378272 RepID=A0ACB8U6Q8_9APHY|nr:hypothetical protein BDY19DRAFT_94041 [Irpex rosettiformis]